MCGGSFDWLRTPLRHRAVAQWTGERLPLVTWIFFLNRNETHPHAALQANRRLSFGRCVLTTRHSDFLVLRCGFVVADSADYMKRRPRESHNRGMTAVPVPQVIGLAALVGTVHEI